MNIGLIGSGGREHALCKKINDSNLVKKIFCFPGNAGTSKYAKNINVDILNFNKLLNEIKNYKIDLIIIGPEEPLVRGMVDFLEKNKIKVFGPNKYAAKLEGSKAFMKKVCKIKNIPTASFKICKNLIDVKFFLKKNKLPLVVKADGLAAGKGVSICKTKDEIIKISKEIFKGKFKSSKSLVLEEFLDGEEASYFILADKKTFKFFGTAQDHKRAYEFDKGPNTGGMGAYSPAPIVSKNIEKKILNKIVKPTLNFLKTNNKHYKGFLYVGLMIKKNEPYLIEFNIRMGDPECQVIMPRLKTDFVKVVNSCIENKLENLKLSWKKEKCMTIVLCSKGYPGNYKKNKILNGLDKFKPKSNEIIFHAGTKIENNKILSNGGRVLNITSLGRNFSTIRKNIIRIIRRINWKAGFYRKDIGWKVIEKNAHYRR